LGGRITGTEGARLAALYLAEVMEELGLSPWSGESFLRPYPQTFGSRDTGLNVAGVIPGWDRTKAIIVSAHYDAIYHGRHTSTEGALDNASGVAAMMRVASSLLRLGVPPEADIVFIAFDGEEIGLRGSRAFVLELGGRYDALFNVNIDCVGLKDAAYIFNFGHGGNDRDRVLRRDMADLFDRRGIAYVTTELTIMSDNLSFAALGIPNVPIVLDLDAIHPYIHTANDVAGIVCLDLVEEMADIITEFLIDGQGRMY